MRLAWHNVVQRIHNNNKKRQWRHFTQAAMTAPDRRRAPEVAHASSHALPLSHHLGLGSHCHAVRVHQVGHHVDLDLAQGFP